MNNLNYGGYSSPNNSSFSSVSSQFSSTPNNTRFQRPRFAYAGPPSYPRPRSSASKPNPEPYFDNMHNPDYDSMRHDDDFQAPVVKDYSHGGTDSMLNNYGDSTFRNHSAMSSSMNSNRDSNFSSNSSNYFTSNESFGQSPKSSLLSDFPSMSSSFRNSSFNYENRPSVLESGRRDLNLSTRLSGLTSSYGLNTFGMTSGFLSSKGNNFGTNRGNFRGRFQKRGGGNKGRGNTNSGNKGAENTFGAMESTETYGTRFKCSTCSIIFTSKIPMEMHFRGARHAKKLKIQEALNSIQGQISQVKEIKRPDGKQFYCELCGIAANSSLQLQMHLEGVKHKAKLQPKENPEDESSKLEEQPTESDTIKTEDESSKLQGQKTVSKKKKSKDIPPNVSTDIHNGKTNGGSVVRPAPADFDEGLKPSKMAKFSCEICEISVNSSVQLQQHLSSKKHQAKVEGKPIIKKRKQKDPVQGDAAGETPVGETPVEETPLGETLVGETPEVTESQVTEMSEKPEVTNVVGMKTLAASFVASETMY